MTKIFKHSTYIRTFKDNGDEEVSQWFNEGDECPKEIEGKVDQAHFKTDEELEASQQDSTSSDYHDMTNRQLRSLLDERGLETGGNKDELVERLEAHDASQ
jgi:hypothetical protein